MDQHLTQEQRDANARRVDAQPWFLNVRLTTDHPTCAAMGGPYFRATGATRTPETPESLVDLLGTVGGDLAAHPTFWAGHVSVPMPYGAACDLFRQTCLPLDFHPVAAAFARAQGYLKEAA